MRQALLSFRISGIPSTIPFHVSALNDDRFLHGVYDTSFINNMRYYSDKDSEIATAIFVHLPKRIQYIQNKDEINLWLLSKYNSFFKPEGTFYHNNIMRWAN